MNERIKELAEQANIKFGRMAILDGDPRGMARLVTYSNLEKFAELIVRECASQLDDGAEDGMWAIGVLYRHFGVEE